MNSSTDSHIGPEQLTVRSEVRDGIALVTLDRPDVRNALNLALRADLQAALVDADQNPDVRVVVLTGAGGNFCSGRDLKAAAAGEPMYPNRAAQLAALQRRTIAKPVIAAIEGFALAGGFELALSCDLIVAAEGSTFGLPEVRRNLVAIGGALIRLPRRIPYHLAMEFALTGEHIPAQRLADAGVVARICPDGQAVAAAEALAAVIAKNGPSAVRATKEIVHKSSEWTSDAVAFDAQMAMAEPALTSPDREEGIQAFLERRDPVWTDI